MFKTTRDFSHVQAAEMNFFSSLVRMKNDITTAGNLSVDKALREVTGFLQSPTTNALDVLVEFDVSDCRKRASFNKMYLGTKLKPDRIQSESQATMFIALASKSAILTKIHLDHEFRYSADHEEHKPSPHFQLGGRVPKSIAGVFNEKPMWDEGVDKPRIPSLPFCSALMWHSAFLEFQECGSVKSILEKNWWLGVVQNAEKHMWTQFATDIQTLIKRQKCVIGALYRKEKS